MKFQSGARVRTFTKCENGRVASHTNKRDGLDHKADGDGGAHFVSVSLRAAPVPFFSAADSDVAGEAVVSRRVPTGSAMADIAVCPSPPKTTGDSASTQFEGEKIGSCGEEDAAAAAIGDGVAPR